MNKIRFIGALSAALASAAVVYGCSTEQTSESNGGGSGSGNAGNGGGGSSGTAGTGAGINVGTGASGNTDVDAGIDDLRDASCAGWTAEPEGLPVVLQLVVDVSGSMDEEAPGSDDSKWEVTQPALAAAIDTFPGSTAVGVLYYPNRDTDDTDENPQDVSACVNVDALIPIAPLGAAGSPQRQALADSLDDAAPDGLTPTHDAYRHALNEGLLASTYSGDRYMLLITDGAPTLSLECVRAAGGGMGGGGVNVVDPNPIVDEIIAARAQGIRTFVIGSPGSEVGEDGEDMRPWLSRAAIEGGTAADGCSETGPNFCHFDMTQAPDFAAALTAALQAITGAVVSCSYELPDPPAGQMLDLTKINAFYTPASGGEPQLIPQAPAGACSEGWQIVDNRVELCADTCSLVQSDQAGRFELLFGCATMVEIPE